MVKIIFFLQVFQFKYTFLLNAITDVTYKIIKKKFILKS